MKKTVKPRRKPLCLAPKPDVEIVGDLDSKTLIVGVDEVGAGCLAGPLVTAGFAYRVDALWADKLSSVPVRVVDSKMLSEKKRVEANNWLREASESCFEIVELSAEKIDAINIYQARMLALSLAAERVIKSFPQEFSSILVVVDGNVVPKDLQKLSSKTFRSIAVTKGDQKVFCVAAASILAKQHRDTLMVDLSREYPFYGWQTNVGYPTIEHKTSIGKHGLTCWHRKSFRSDL